MAGAVRARRLTYQEGQRLQQIVRRGKHGSVRVRRAVIIMASASGTPVTAIARLVAADQLQAPFLFGKAGAEVMVAPLLAGGLEAGLLVDKSCLAQDVGGGQDQLVVPGL